jgi:hypothetical protein
MSKLSGYSQLQRVGSLQKLGKHYSALELWTYGYWHHVISEVYQASIFRIKKM